MGFLGGFACTALVLVLGNRNGFYVPLQVYSLRLLPASVYSPLLSVSLSAISIDCLIDSAAVARVASNVSTFEMGEFANLSYAFAIASFIWALCLILASETTTGALFIGVFGSVLWM